MADLFIHADRGDGVDHVMMDGSDTTVHVILGLGYTTWDTRSAVAITQLRIKWHYGSGGFGASGAFKVEGSNTGIAGPWTLVYEETVDPAVTYGHSYPGDYEETFTFAEATYRYWKFTSTTSGNNDIFTMEGLGTAPLVAAFSGTPLTGVRPLAVQFTDLSGPVTSWEWDFGDGSTSTERDPLHVYTVVGVYTVTLIVKNSEDVSDAETKVNYVTVTQPPASDPTDTPGEGVWVDWQGDGFNTSGGSSSDNELARSLPEPTGLGLLDDDITLLARKVTWNRQGQPDLIGGQSPSTCTIIVGNENGYFSPDNTASPFYGYLKPGKKVWVGGTRTDLTTKGLWAGFLKEIVPVPGGSREAQLVCEDQMGRWQRGRSRVSFGTNRTARTFREAVLDAANFPTGTRILADEPYTLAVSGADEKNILGVLERINRAAGTRHWIVPADNKNVHFYYRTMGRNEALGLDDPVTTLTDMDITGMTGLRLTAETIINYQQVSLHPFRFNVSEEVWRYKDVPFALAATDLRVVKAAFNNWVKDAAVIVESTGSITSTLVSYGKSADITLQGVGQVTALYVTGKLAVEGGSTVEYAEDLVSQATYDTVAEGSPVDIEFIAEGPQAKGLAEAVVARAAEPRYRPQVQFRNRFDKTLSFDLGDVVEQSVDELDLVRRFEVTGVTGSIDEGGKVWDFSWTYLETLFQTTMSLFTLDESLLDGPDLLGF